MHDSPQESPLTTHATGYQKQSCKSRLWKTITGACNLQNRHNVARQCCTPRLWKTITGACNSDRQDTIKAASPGYGNPLLGRATYKFDVTWQLTRQQCDSPGGISTQTRRTICNSVARGACIRVSIKAPLSGIVPHISGLSK